MQSKHKMEIIHKETKYQSYQTVLSLSPRTTISSHKLLSPNHPTCHQHIMPAQV